MPEISIILPSYNVEKYIAKSIQSVINQTFKDFELLVVIDGSPDNSKKIAEKYAKKDQRIKVFEKENGGLSDARNYGLTKAKGNFIYFMDSDDWIESNLLEENLNLIKKENLNFIVFGYIQDNENEDGEVIDSYSIIPKIKIYKKEIENLKIDSHHLGLLGYAWNKIYRKSFLDKHLFQFEKGISLVEDILFNAPIYTVSDEIRFNQKAYYHYLNRPTTTLIKTFHPDSFELKKKKHFALEKFMNSWEINNRENILAQSFIDGIRGGIHNLFSYKNQLNETEKKSYLRKMYNDDITKNLIRNYDPNTLKKYIHKILVKYRLVHATYFFAKLIK